MPKYLLKVLAVILMLLWPLQTFIVRALEVLHIFAWGSTDRLATRRLEVAIEGLSEKLHGTRIAHISDIHAHKWNGPLINRLVRRVNEEKPDLILLTGDFVTDDPAPMKSLSAALSNLEKTPLGIFASLGNHDYRCKSAVVEGLERAGIRVLENTSVSLAGGCLNLIGLADLWRGNFDPVAGFSAVSGESPTLVMSHNPDTAARLGTYRADMIFSGHTHGGTVRLPLFGSIYPTFNRIMKMIPHSIQRHVPYSKQIDVIKNLKWIEGAHALPRSFDAGSNFLTVSRGVGNHPNGFRIFCEPEFSIITLRFRTS